MSGHTPGPWRARKSVGHTGDWGILAKDGSPKELLIGESYRQVSLTPYEDPNKVAPAEANARLMATAPDMLAALKDLVAYAGMVPPQIVTNIALAVIAKAEGRQ